VGTFVTHLRHRLDPVIHFPTRFSIMAALMAADRAEFRFSRDTVELTDSALSRQVTTLEQAGYVKVTKGRSAAGPAPGCRPRPPAGRPSAASWPC
jgi:DNA-binding MarR family transcriptional regulator